MKEKEKLKRVFNQVASIHAHTHLPLPLTNINTYSHLRQNVGLGEW